MRPSVRRAQPNIAHFAPDKGYLYFIYIIRIIILSVSESVPVGDMREAARDNRIPARILRAGIEILQIEILKELRYRVCFYVIIYPISVACCQPCVQRTVRGESA